MSNQISYTDAIKRGRPFNRYWKGAFRGQMTPREVWQWGEHASANAKRIRIIVSPAMDSGYPTVEAVAA